MKSKLLNVFSGIPCRFTNQISTLQGTVQFIPNQTVLHIQHSYYFTVCFSLQPLRHFAGLCLNLVRYRTPTNTTCICQIYFVNIILLIFSVFKSRLKKKNNSMLFLHYCQISYVWKLNMAFNHIYFCFLDVGNKV